MKSSPHTKNDNLINTFPDVTTHMVLYETKITIGLKKGISDPEGVNTLKALHLLGFNAVKEAKTVRTVDLLIDGKNKEKVEKQVEQMCQRLLTNPVIHTYKIEIIEK